MRKLKDSGIEWLSEIPQNWEVKRLKQILAERNEKNNPIKSTNLLSLSIERGVFPYSEKTGGGNKAKENFEDYKLTYENDIVLNSMNIIVGAVGLSKYYGCVSPVYYTLYSRNNNYNINYYSNIFQSSAFQKSLWGLGNGIVVKESDNGKLNTIRMRIPMEKLNNVLMPIPPKVEQERIANFLDNKVLEIENIIKKAKETIEDYKKYKQSIITEVVTKGLEKNVELKDSGIDWIGEIPEEWNVCKIKYILQDNEFGIKCGPFGSALTGRVSGENNIYIYGQWNIVDDDFSIKRNTINEESYALLQNYSVISGDILVSMMGTIGKCAIVPNNINKGIIDSHVIKIRLNEKKVLSKFFKYQYDKDNSFVIMEHLNRTKKGSIMDGLNTAIVKNAYFVLPPLNDQERIIKFLDKKVDEIDRIINNKLKIIEELEQYKKSLIYEYVTGKKEVI